MDRYLRLDESFKRLFYEYKKYNSLVIAFDFDNTVYDYHQEGDTYNDIIELLRELKQLNFYLICFTANENEEFVHDYLVDNLIPFDSINKNPPFYESKSAKIYYNALLDDRAGLLQVYEDLKRLIKIIK